MKTTTLELLGWITTFLFGACYIPQLIKTVKTKTVRDISVEQWFIQGIAYVLGLVYGIGLHENPLIFGYLFGLCCTIFFLLCWVVFRV